MGPESSSKLPGKFNGHSEICFRDFGVGYARGLQSTTKLTRPEREDCASNGVSEARCARNELDIAHSGTLRSDQDHTSVVTEFSSNGTAASLAPSCTLTDRAGRLFARTSTLLPSGFPTAT